MKRVVLFTLILVCSAVVARAQDCGQGLPCGPIPWKLPKLPPLASPTPMPTIAATIAPTGVTPTPTLAPVATLQSTALDTGDLDHQVATLNAVIAQTPAQILDINGTPVDTNATFSELGANAGQFFGYTRSLTAVSFGSLSPLISFSLLAFVTVIAVKLIGFILPLIAAIFSVVRKVVQLILDFLPF